MIRRIVGLGGGLFLLAALATPTMAQDKIPVTSHDLAGKENCMMCHAAGVMPPVPDVPATHKDRGNESCQWCHAPDAPMQTKAVPPVAHDLAGKDNCMMCHAAGVMPPVPDVPADHKNRGNQTCGWCHIPKAG